MPGGAHIIMMILLLNLPPFSWLIPRVSNMKPPPAAKVVYQASLEIFKGNLLKYNVTEKGCAPCYEAAERSN